MAIMIIQTTSVGQPIILYIAAMGNIDNSLVKQPGRRCDWISKFSEDQMLAFFQQPLTSQLLQPSTHSNVSPWFSFWLQVVQTTQQVHLMYYSLRKSLPIDEYGYVNTIGVFLAVMIAIVSFQF